MGSRDGFGAGNHFDVLLPSVIERDAPDLPDGVYAFRTADDKSSGAVRVMVGSAG